MCFRLDHEAWSHRDLCVSDWIMKLGPIGIYYGFELYEYSLISTPDKLLLFVLARDVPKFKVLSHCEGRFKV